ncbi:MAG TPA: glycosyl hydrolase [Actinoplanes sp.]
MTGQSTVDGLWSGFVAPPTSAAPMMRWWWFGPAVERAELDRELTAMARAGFGGVEVAYVYPLAPATTEFLSDVFLSDLRFAAERANELGLRFDLTLGSGWSFGGPHITADLAARQLRWERREIGPGPLTVAVTSPWPGDELIAAYLGAGSTQEPPRTCEQLAIVDNAIRIPDGAGPRQVLLVYTQRTGQNVKRAAAGSEGPVLDHYSAAAVDAHIRHIGDRMLDAVPAELVGSVFCDSLEVYGADWTAGLPGEFARRRGYPLLPILYRLVVEGPDAFRVRADYHRTLAELYQENFIDAFRRWAAGRGVPFRIQNYGTPPASLSSYRFADLFEGEGWGWQEITPTRWASSAAHLYGRAVTSAEVWTWVHAPSFRATPLDLKAEAHEHLLNGINQLIGHGWPYSPADAPGLGWFFYAAGALDDRNPWWPAMPELNAYLARLCWLLRQGDPVADVAVYVPTEDLFATMGAGVGGSLDTWREANRRIPGAVPAAIRAAGLDYDLIDDDALAVVPADRYRVVVLPATTTIPDGTAGWLDDVTAAGGSVLTVGSSVSMPGAVAVPVDALAEALNAAVEPDLVLSPPTPDIGFVHRRCLDVDVYVLANTGAERRTFRVVGRGSATEWDPASRQVRPLDDGRPMTLHPHQATVIVRTSMSNADDPAPEPSEWQPVDGPWRVAFADEPPHPVDLPHVWEEQPGRRYFSGAATYTATFELDDIADGARVLVDLGESRIVGTDRTGQLGRSYRAAVAGPVGEIAQVRLNGVPCGIAWAPPYRLDLSAAAGAGRNDIEITVFNTAANALAADDDIARLAADSEARYGLRFRMQQLERAMTTVRSGLLAVPRVGVTRPRSGSPTPDAA